MIHEYELARHPGRIQFIDGDTGALIADEDASEVPVPNRFAETDRGLVPIVKVVARSAVNERAICEYGPDGELLRITWQCLEA